MNRYQLNVPEGWHRMEEFCESGLGSKAYKSNGSDANVHVVDLCGSGAWNVNGEDEEGNTFSTRYYDYFDALAHARGWMLKQ